MGMRKNRRDEDSGNKDEEGGFDFMTAGSLMLHWGGYRVYSGPSLALRLFHRAFLAVVSVVTASFIALSFITMASPDFGKEAKMTTLGFLGNVTVAAWGPVARWATNSSLTRAIRLILSGLFSYSDNDEELRQQQKAIKNRIIKIIKLLHYYLTWVCLSSSIGNTFLIPLAHYFEGGHKGINNYLPIRIYYPFDTRTYAGYAVAFLLDWLIWTQVYVVGISFILVYVGCCLQLTAEIEVLNDSLRNIEKRARYIFEKRGYTSDQEDLFDNEEFQNILYTCLRQNVLHHRRILRLTELIRPYIESANACGIVVFSAILASDIFLILMNPRKNFMLVFAALAELFGYVQMCGVGEVITNSSKETTYALYWTPWYRCNKKFNVTFQIIMTRTMKPVIFGSKFINVPYSLETFANKLNKANEMSGFNNQPQSYYSDDCCGGSVGSDEDLITDYLGVEEMGEKQPEIIGRIGPSPLVPTISVTPHSPAGKNYPILEDNLDQLHYIHESVQQMRDLTLQPVSTQEGSRLSASCPSLNETGSDPDLMSSLNSTPTQTLTITTPAISCSNSHKRGSGEWELYKRNRGPEGDSEVSRRRSWAALEDLSHCKETVTKTGRHRSGNDFCSISLSSMESDMEDPFCKSTTNLLGSNEVKARVRQVHPNSSTHSLNEADLQSDFKKIVSKREGEVRLLNSHLSSPLQKSVSTPSIIAVRELANAEIATIESSNSTLPVGCRGFATESDEDENLAAMLEQEKHLASSDYFTHAAYDKHPEKRRKRGSLFFRKKKDKTKKSTHHWVSVCYGNAQACDLCSKSLMNKSAVFCEICEVNVHQNSCRDNIADCKGKGSKIIKGSASFGKSSNKRGSHPNQTISPSSIHNYDDHHYRGNQHDNYSFSDEVPLVSYEFLDEPPLTVNDLDTDPFLGLQDEEPDSWTPTVTKEIVKKLKEKEVKRQEHLYEFILTEKHHCLTLRVMQKVFVEGLQKYLQFGSNVQRIFPRLADLTEIHLGFLHKLRARQREAPVIETIGDILEEQFSGPLAERLKSVYGEFCSNHRNAIDIYKDYMQNDSRFAEFVKHCQGNPLLKKKGIPECILFVTQRLTKYPLLIEPLIKTTKDNKDEQSRLVRALSLIKEILVEVDAQVAEKEKEDRKIEIYNKLEPKSFTLHRGQKFKKTDLLGENRKLRFEGIAMLMQGRGKMQVVLVIVFSDVLCFLLENSNKYSFFTPENKAGVISLQKLLVREKAGQESRGIYLISSNPADPEMFELKVHNPKDKQVWIKAIRAAVQECPEDDEDRRGQVMSAEEKQKQFDSKQLHMKEIVELLRQKDREQAQILEEKMALHLRLLATAGVENVPERPDYLPLVAEQLDNSQIRKDVLTAVKKVNQLAKSLYASATNLSRSASSVGERQSETYISPTLPKRAETFGGFDNQPAAVRGAVQKKHVNKETNTDLPTLSPDTMRKLFRPPLPDSAFFVNEGLDLADEEPEKPHLLTTSHDHQLAAIQLSHHVYTLSCIISQQMTKIDSLKAELASLKTHVGDSGKPVYRHNQQLEELRNLQDKLQSEKEIWQRDKENEMKELEQQREELFHLQEQIRIEQADITQQREKLYRKLEALNSQGILMGTSIPAMSPDDTNPWSNTVMHTPPSDPPKRKSDPTKWKQPQQNKSNTLPLNLISATNQQKVASNVQIKQQLPLKLASKLGGGGGGSSPGSSLSGPQQMLPLKLSQGAGAPADPKKSSGYQRLSTTPPQLPTHSRTGSSPAMMQNIQGELKTGAKAGRTNTYPKLPDKFKIRSSDSSEDTVPANNSEEEVIFF